MGNEKEKAYLLLEDGTVFEGESMGARSKAMGMVVFNTGMVGYQQLLTARANQGLLLTQTFPLIGNYGVNSGDSESETAWAAGYIVREHCEQPSNFKCEGTLDDFLREKGVTGLCGIDTRRLTRYIRKNGEMRGVIAAGTEFDKTALLAELYEWEYAPELLECPVLGGLSAAIGTTASHRVAVIDLGMPRSMELTLLGLGMSLTIFPAGQAVLRLGEIREGGFDGVFLSDGPGDPTHYPELIAAIRTLLKTEIPIFGVSLGHQLLALAHGLETRRLSRGHRGANQPVSSLLTGRTHITAQNHGYVVDSASLDGTVCDVTFENSNDHTVEGLAYRDGFSFGVQFLPDSLLPGAEIGNHSTAFLYEEFAQMMKDRRNK